MTIERDEFIKWLRLNSRSFDIVTNSHPYSQETSVAVHVTLDLPELIILN